MSTTIELARQALLDPAGLSDSELQSVLGGMLGKSIDDADMYFQTIRHESWILEDGIIKEGNFNIERGVGVRAVSGEKTGFAYSDDIVLPNLEQAANAAGQIADRGQNGQLKINSQLSSQTLYSVDDPLISVPELDKLQLLHRVEAEARKCDPNIKKVIATLAGTFEIILVVAGNGSLTADVRPLVRLDVTVIAEDAKGERQQATAGGGGRSDYKYFFENDRALGYAREAARQAILNLDAQPAPAGTMPVVLGPGWPGVLLHEAVGHGLEGDFNRKKSSAFSDCIGQRVAAPGCTVVDDGTLKGRRGSLHIDDEGTPTECTTLIEDGILKGYMQDKQNARLMSMKSTGNGRRESYAHLPMPRMTNTYMLAGQHDPKEIIASVKKGLYAVNFSGGQVDITSGKFVFTSSEAYLIEDGKVTTPVKGATLIGNGPDVLTRVKMLGNDLELDTGVGVCGKNGQGVPVGVGQPTMLIDALTVGGTK